MFPADVERYQKAGETAKQALTLPSPEARAMVALALSWTLKTPPGGCGGLTYEKWRLSFLNDAPDTQLRRWAGADFVAVGPELAQLCGDVWPGPLPPGAYDPDAPSILDPLWAALDSFLFWAKLGIVGGLTLAALYVVASLISAGKR